MSQSHEEKRMQSVRIIQNLCGGGPVDPADPDGLQYARFPADWKEARDCGAPCGEYRRIMEDTRPLPRLIKENQ